MITFKNTCLIHIFFVFSERMSNVLTHTCTIVMVLIIAWAVLITRKHSNTSISCISTWKSSIWSRKTSTANCLGNILDLKETWDHICITAKDQKVLIVTRNSQARRKWSNRCMSSRILLTKYFKCKICDKDF